MSSFWRGSLAGRRNYRLFDPYRLAYDLIFIDCPPSLAILPVNALRAATAVLVPLQCEYYAMEGLGSVDAGFAGHAR